MTTGIVQSQDSYPLIFQSKELGIASRECALQKSVTLAASRALTLKGAPILGARDSCAENTFC